MFLVYFPGKINQSENSVKNKDTPVEPQVRVEKMYPLRLSPVVPAEIQRFDLDSSGTEYNWGLPSRLAQYINRYITAHERY